MRPGAQPWEPGAGAGKSPVAATRCNACERGAPGNGTNLSAIADCRIAVTALKLDLTDEPFMTRLAQLFG